MHFRSILQFHIPRDNRLEAKSASPRDPAEDEDEENSKLHLHCEFMNDGNWLRELTSKPARSFDRVLPGGEAQAKEHARAGRDPDPVQPRADQSSQEGDSEGGVDGGTSASSDWNVLPSGSFDETYFECAYTDDSGGMTSESPTPTESTHLEVSTMNEFEPQSGGHELPPYAMPYLGSCWFVNGRDTSVAENGFILPAMGAFTNILAPGAGILDSGAAFAASSCAPSFQSDGMEYASTIAKHSNDLLSRPCCLSDVPSPVHMEHFVPFLSCPPEPPEFLFEDMSCWPGAPVDVNDQRHYQQPHELPLYNAAPSRAVLPHHFVSFEDLNANSSTTAMTLRDQVPAHQCHQLQPPAYPLMQSQEETTGTDTRWSTAGVYHQHLPAPATHSTTSELAGHQTNSFSSRNDSRGTGNSLTQAARARQPDQVDKRTLRSSTLCQRTASHRPSATGATLMTSKELTSPVGPFSTFNTMQQHQLAQIQLLTPLNDCYWKNGRKNLQCFPSCPEHHDFYSMKMNNRKHSSVGVCRGPVYCHAFTSASDGTQVSTSVPSSGLANGVALARQMKYEHGVGASGSGGGAQELFVLGRFERVPQQETTNLLEELRPPPTFQNAVAFEQFRYTCFQAVEMEERRVLLPESSSGAPQSSSGASKSNPTNPKNVTFIASVDKKRVMRSTWFFLPDVWKVQPMLKKKRKATRSAPAQTFPFCFRIFIYARDATNRAADADAETSGYSCIAATASSFFELYSTRTVDRVKRKFWSGGCPEQEGNAVSDRAMKRQRQHGLKRV
ncbi:hypothetical protein BBJ28_00015601 [Nothophytophthora sp. Chile5]|nr:hypothetical protein BBJ28_00015601 [Nothophytophthora sp. Chile5]